MLVDDEAHITDLLTFNLESEHFNVQVVDNAADVPGRDLTGVRMILVDAMKQPYTGLDMLRDLKANPATAHIPVLVLSYIDNEDAIIEAFDAGADDYIFKPFSLRELLARLRSILRRHPLTTSTPDVTPLKLVFDELEIDLLTRGVTVEGKPVSLTPTEY